MLWQSPVSAYTPIASHSVRGVPGADRLMQVIFPVLYKQVPEGLPQHLDTKRPGVDTAGVHRAHEQNEDKSGGEQKHAVDAHRDDCQDTSSNGNKQVPADRNLC